MYNGYKIIALCISKTVFENALKRSDEKMYAVKVKKTNRRMD